MLMTKCRLCGEPNLEPILSFGSVPLANSLLTADQLDQPEPRYPLDLVFCPSCTLVQITYTVPPEELFRHYLYFSSFSDTVLEHSRRLAEELIESRHLGEESQVIELASNDGYLLKYFVQADIPVLGIDPARNIARVAEKEGVPTLSEFFSVEVAEQVKKEHGPADVIIANNVLAHVDDLNGFIEGIKLLLKKRGVAVIEVPSIKQLIDKQEFDTIYHEHLSYFSVTALDLLFKRHDLLLSDIKKIDIHGGSLRLFVTHPGSAGDRRRVKEVLLGEEDWGVHTFAFYEGFAEKIKWLQTVVCDVLRGLKTQGRSIAAYGAAAKGSILLNTFGLGDDLLDFVVDRSTHKQGMFMPGVHIPIYSPHRLLEEMPDYVLMLTWNFCEEILEQQAEYRNRGGKFFIPIPEVKIV
ncbi:MAG: class I SAM-dependent methyltransferase [Candidatus Auribacterota bacterium]|nr:class I SAM-dependent methyltransferase [Candidatus Auribacterota bacterium]